MQNLFYKTLNDSRTEYRKNPNLDKLKINPTSPSNKGIYNDFRTSMQNMYQFIKGMIDEHPEMTNDELSLELYHLLYELSSSCAESPSFKGDSIRVDIEKYFLNHPSEFKEVYDELIQKEKETGIPVKVPRKMVYTSNIEMSKRLYVSELIEVYRSEKAEVQENEEVSRFLDIYANVDSGTQRRLREGLDKDSSEYAEYTKMFFRESEFAGIKEFVAQNKV